MITIKFNGTATEVPDSCTLREFIQSCHTAPHVIIDWNDDIITLEDARAAQFLADGDRVNLFSMVGGG